MKKIIYSLIISAFIMFVLPWITSLDKGTQPFVVCDG